MWVVPEAAATAAGLAWAEERGGWRKWGRGGGAGDAARAASCQRPGAALSRLSLHSPQESSGLGRRGMKGGQIEGRSAVQRSMAQHGMACKRPCPAGWPRPAPPPALFSFQGPPSSCLLHCPVTTSPSGSPSSLLILLLHPRRRGGGAAGGAGRPRHSGAQNEVLIMIICRFGCLFLTCFFFARPPAWPPAQPRSLASSRLWLPACHFAHLLATLPACSLSAPQVRWCAAKGLGRLTGRLPRDLGDEVVGSLLEGFFTPGALRAVLRCAALFHAAPRCLALPATCCTVCRWRLTLLLGFCGRPPAAAGPCAPSCRQGNPTELAVAANENSSPWACSLAAQLPACTHM